jgi:3-oxoacyl-[acyl-carrier-protein] synthase-1
MERAVKDADIAYSEIEYVNAHATSTPAGDAAEALALRELFSTSGHRPAVSSTKGLTGHGLSMAGAMETAFCALAMKEGFIPGNAHLADIDSACAGLELPRETLARSPRVVLKNSSGFGGSNVCLILKSD